MLGVSLKIGGTYHSRVRDVSKGIGHIGTTLNPGWVGRSLIALHNCTKNPIKIYVGDPIVTICFYYLKSKSTIGETNESARKDVLQEYELCSDDCKAIYGVDYSKDFKLLKIRMVNDEKYRTYKKERTRIAKNIILIAGTVLIFIGLVVWMLLAKKYSNIYDILRCVLIGFFGIFAGIFAIILGVKIGNRYIK